jgi:hypothetical protein
MRTPASQHHGGGCSRIKRAFRAGAIRMSHYEKIAVVAIRVIGCCVVIYALIGVVYSFVGYIITREPYNIYFYSSITYVIVGAVLFALSKPLAALIARRL